MTESVKPFSKLYDLTQRAEKVGISDDDVLREIRIEKIVPNKYQPRREFTEDKIKELRSVAVKGTTKFVLSLVFQETKGEEETIKDMLVGSVEDFFEDKEDELDRMLLSSEDWELIKRCFGYVQKYKKKNSFPRYDIFNLPSPHVTLTDMLVLKNRIKKAFISENFDGVVITHGTDTLEETAFFLDTTLSRGKPIVLTGAMRSSNELGTDGIYNLLTAIRVAADSNSSDRGVLVVMNDEIHSARYVTKTHTTNVSTFQTPTHGPVGLLTKNKIIYFHKDSENQHLDVDPK